MPTRQVANLDTIRPEMQFKYKDIFDLKEFYEALRQWLTEFGWVDEDDESEHWESHYGENIDNQGVREIWIRWRPIKKSPATPFMKYYLDFNWHMIGITSTEVIKDGKKLKVNKGEAEIKMTAYIEHVYKAEFSKNPILKYMNNLFYSRIYKKTIEQRRKEVYQEFYEMVNFMKQWFKLKRYLPYEEYKGYYRSYAWPSHMPDEQQ